MITKKHKLRPGPVLIFVLLAVLVVSLPASVAEKADMVRVFKSRHQLELMKNGEVTARYHVVFGASPQGHKTRQGDERTPEGRYILDYKKKNSDFYRAIHISYPNANDREAAKARGEDPGGAIMIHGQPNGYGWFSFLLQRFNWTDGCIALTNSDMDKVWAAVDPGIPIHIHP